MILSHDIIKLSEVDEIDLEYVGKKASEFSELAYLKIPIPEGFVIKTSFFEDFLEITGIHKEIEDAKKIQHPSLKDPLAGIYKNLEEKILNTHIPYNLAINLHEFYRNLAGALKESSVDIISSSKTSKSIEFLNITGDTNVVLKIKAIWSAYLKEPVAVIVIKNIKSSIKGKIFTNHPIFDKKLTKEQINKLDKYCKIIQKHFYFPKEIEYVVKNNKIIITRINPFTGIISNVTKKIFRVNKLNKSIIKAFSINPGIATGPVRIFNKYYGITKIRKGEIAVIPNLNTTLNNKIRIAKAIIVDSIAPNYRDIFLYKKNFHIPTVEGAKNAAKVFHNGNIVTVNGMTGEIYSGGLIY